MPAPSYRSADRIDYTIVPSIARIARRLRNCDDLVRFVGHVDLPEHEPPTGRECGNYLWIASFVPFCWYDRRSVLPSKAITPVGVWSIVQSCYLSDEATLELVSKEKKDDIGQFHDHLVYLKNKFPG